MEADTQKSAEAIRDSLIFFFSDDGANLRDLTEHYVVDGIDSLNKAAFLELVDTLGFQNLIKDIPRDNDFFISEDE